MKNEETVYPTDILRSKYVTVLEAANMNNTTIARVLEMVKDHKIPYALFIPPEKRKKVMHVNHEDVAKVLKEEGESV